MKGNWIWRCREDQLVPGTAAKLAGWAELYGRT